MAQAQFLVSVTTLLCHGLGSFSSCCAEHISKVALRPHWRGESSDLTPLLGDPGRSLLGSWSSITLPTSPAFGAAVDREGAGRFQPCRDRASSPFLIPAGSDPSSASTTQRGGLYPPWCTWGLPSMEERVWPRAPPHSLPRCPFGQRRCRTRGDTLPLPRLYLFITRGCKQQCFSTLYFLFLSFVFWNNVL